MLPLRGKSTVKAVKVVFEASPSFPGRNWPEEDKAAVGSGDKSHMSSFSFGLLLRFV